MPINSEEDAFNFLIDAQANRSVGEHQLNRKSSRSHVITTCYVTRSKVEGESITG